MRNSRAFDEGQGSPSVLLVSMPWTTLTEPSLGLGLLKAVLDREGISCRVLHLNIFLLEYLEARTYHGLANVYALNDFLFSGALDPAVTNLQQRWLRQKLLEIVNQGYIDPHKFGGSEGTVQTLLHLRTDVFPRWLEKWADEISASSATLVGFSCMFDQTISSLALAKLITDRSPDKMIALGGYGVRTPAAEMILRSSPWVEAVCAGDGEGTIIGLADASIGRVRLEEVPGIFMRLNGEVIMTRPAPPADLNSNPAPNFDDFFADLRRLSDEKLVDITPLNLPIENSRGCWWGAKGHCVFCGIRDDDLSYREREPENAMELMTELTRRYGINVYRFADYIMPHRYLETLVPELERRGAPFRICAEMKSNITEEKFAQLARAGFEEIQPGVESFSSDALRKMSKGVSGVQNVFFVLLGCKYGIRVFYNLIYAFPGDDEEDYARMARMLPRLFHLTAPTSCVPVQITRFAPLQVCPERFGIPVAMPDPCYEIVFSKDYVRDTGFDVSEYCYYFERPFSNSVRLEKIYDDIDSLVKTWRRLIAAKESWLYYENPYGNDEMVIHDKRGYDERIHRLDPACASVLLECSRPVRIGILKERLSGRVALSKLAAVVQTLDDLGLIFVEGDWLLSLVLPGMDAGKSEQS